MKCEEIDPLLLEFVEGDLPDERAGAIRTHIRDCPSCAAKARETRNLLGDFGVAASIERRVFNSQDGTLPAAAPRPVGRPARLGDFEILDELGRGGMGIVYRARQVTLNRIVALKVLQAGVVLNERAVARFQKEAQAAARLHHTNIVPVYAQSEQDGFFYYAMELIQGEPLDRVLNRSPSLVTLTDLPLDARTARTAETATHPLAAPPSTLAPGADATTLAADATHPLPLHGAGAAPTPSDSHAASYHPGAAPDPGVTVHLTRRHSEYKRIARLVAEVADALHHAHQLGIVHRDIKPQNLLLGHDDKLHITDFGLARLLDEPHLTMSAEIIGTPSYMSPEQIRGVRDEIDHRTDIYSLGVTLYQMLTLRTPFTGESYDQIITRILKQEPRSPRRLDPYIPGDIETICLRAMEKDPRKRFASAKELADDLRRYAGDFPIVSRRIGPVGKLIRLVKRHPARSAVVVTLTLLALLVPTTTSIAIARANEDIDGRWSSLFENYRNADSVMRDLGWITERLCDKRKLTLLRAFGSIRSDAAGAIALLQGILHDHPDDREACYLMAWASAREEHPGAEIEGWVKRGDESPVPETWAGHFFRGQALVWADPVEANRSFQKAINERPNFLQARLHSVRATNFRMYLLRDVELYGNAVNNLDFVCELQPRDAYPRYLQSITHRLGAEVYLRTGDNQRAEERYQQSLAAARAAQLVEARNPRGVVAEAEWLESREQFAAALAMYERVRGPRLACELSDARERDKQLLRLYFWSGDYAAAEKCRSSAFFKPLEQSADAAVLEALLARSGGDPRRAERALRNAFDRRPAATVLRLDLLAGYQLAGVQPPPMLLEEGSDDAAQLPARWTTAWLRLLVDSLTGRRPWSDVEIESAARRTAEAVTDPDARRIRYQLLMAGARYYRGVWLLAEGRRDAALEQFSDWWRYSDFEIYCYRSKLLYFKLKLDPTWPAWLPAGASE